MTPAALLARVTECGHRVEVTPTGPRLVPVVDGAILPPGLLSDLKRHRAALVAYLTTCAACDRDVSDPECRERLTYCNPFCDLTRCPYRKW